MLVEQVMNQDGTDERPQSNAAIRRYVEIALLALVGGWAYFANLHLSLLEGSEGLYAGIAGEMGRRREFFDQHLSTPPVSGLCPRTSRLFHHKRLPKKTILSNDV